jgi:hypothetical protein
LFSISHAPQEGAKDFSPQAANAAATAAAGFPADGKLAGLRRHRVVVAKALV